MKTGVEAKTSFGPDVDANAAATSTPMAGPGLVKAYQYGLKGITNAFCETKCKAEAFTDLKGEPVPTCVPLNGGEEYQPHATEPCFMCTDAGGVCALAKTYEGFLKNSGETIEGYKPKEE